ncbi:MAG: HIT domain-containing protein [Rhodospirillales bacterium]|nr:HIT domain-containing protein [Rhodospirillales bacterium]
MFTLHPRLAADTIELARWELSLVLLMNDSAYPWLILVPRRPEITEIFQLAAEDRNRLMEEITRASRILDQGWRPRKINVAALGNMVPQLHVHVLARFEEDPAWPHPVWGVASACPYADGELAEMRRRFAETSGLIS